MRKVALSIGLLRPVATKAAMATTFQNDETTISALMHTISDLNKQIDSLKSRLSGTQNQAQIKELQTKLQQYSNQLESLQSSNAQNLKALSLKDAFINNLQDKVKENETLREQFATLTQRLESAGDTIQQLQDQQKLQAQQVPSSPSKRKRTEDHTFVDRPASSTFVEKLHAALKTDKFVLMRLYRVHNNDAQLLLYIGIVQWKTRKWQIKWYAIAKPLIDNSERFGPCGNPEGDLRRMCKVPSGKIQLNNCNDRPEDFDEDWFGDAKNAGEYFWCSGFQASIHQLHNLFAYGDSALLLSLEAEMKSHTM